MFNQKQGGFFMEYKHHFSSRNKKANHSNRFLSAIIVIIFLGLIAGVLVFSPAGDYLLTNVLSPVFSCSKEKEEDRKIITALNQQDEKYTQNNSTAKPSEKTHQVITIDEIPLFILQMGSFLEQEAAEHHADEIRQLGAGGAVFVDGSIYRVFAAAYLDDKSAGAGSCRRI